MVLTFLLCGGTSFILLPSKIISPESGFTNPAIARNVVVLPHPEGPKSVINYFSFIYKFKFSNMVFSPNFTVTSLRSIIFFNYALPLCNPIC